MGPTNYFDRLTPTAIRSPGDEGALIAVVWRRSFLLRHGAFAALAVLALLLPDFGPNRLWVAAFMGLVVLPLNILIDFSTRESGRIAPALPFLDQMSAAVIVGMSDDLLPAAIVSVVAVAAVSAALYNIRVAAGAAVVGMVLLSAIAVVQDTIEENAAVLVVGVFGSGVALSIVGMVASEERTLRRRFSATVDGVDVLLYELEPTEPPRFEVNAVATEWFGEKPKEFGSGFFTSRVHPDDLDEVIERHLAIVDEPSVSLSFRLRMADGRYHQVVERLLGEYRADGSLERVRGAVVDVERQHEAEQRAFMLDRVISRVPVGVLLARVDEADQVIVTYMNEEIGAIFDRPLLRRQEVELSAFAQRLPAERVQRFAQFIRMVVANQETAGLSDFTIPVAGSDRAFAIEVMPLSEREVAVIVESGGEVEDLLRDARERVRLDPLTGLGSRSAVADRIEECLEATTDTDAAVTVAVIDVARFRAVNDALGQRRSDLVLEEIGRRLGLHLTDAEVIGRLHADRFAAVWKGSFDPGELARRVLATMDDRVAVEEGDLQLHLRVGMVVSSAQLSDADTLMRAGEVALSRSTSAPSWRLYDESLERGTRPSVALLTEMGSALHSGQYLLHYQPIVRIDDGSVSAVEALVRWNHPERGLVPPGEFIAAAATAGLLGDLTRWVIDQAISDCQRLQVAGRSERIAVNLAASDLVDAGLVGHLEASLERSRVDGSRLKIEVSEADSVIDLELARPALQSLDNLGVGLVLDDFGAGSIPLVRLPSLPFSELKIDPQLVRHALIDKAVETVIRCVVDLGQGLRMAVVAEGVEDQRTAARMQSLGCELMQGFYISRPLPIDDLLVWLQQRT